MSTKLKPNLHEITFPDIMSEGKLQAEWLIKNFQREKNGNWVLDKWPPACRYH